MSQVGTAKCSRGRNNLGQMGGTFWGRRMQTQCWEDALDDMLGEWSLYIHLSAVGRRW